MDDIISGLIAGLFNMKLNGLARLSYLHWLKEIDKIWEQ